MPIYVDFTPYTAAKNNFECNPGLCELFKFLAIETWKRLEFTYIKPYIRVYETTLTQNIGFTINAYKEQFPSLSIELWEAEDEKSNGNDLELILKFDNNNFDFYAAIQAKKIDRHGKYYAMEHGDQIISLIDYAERLNGYPLYLLYNYIEPFPRRITDQQELYGCSIVDAYHLKDNYYNTAIRRKRDGSIENKWEIPHFNDLHPENAFPWHELVCNSSPTKIMRLLSTIMDDGGKKIALQEILKNNQIDKEGNALQGFVDKKSISTKGWYKSTDKDILKGKKNIELFYSEVNEKKEKHYEFNPKTRVEITIKKNSK